MRFRPSPQLVRQQYIDLRSTAAFKRWWKRQYRRQWGLCVHGFHRLQVGHIHTDHLDAVANGGTNSFLNFALSCSSCNLLKGSRRLTTPYLLTIRSRLVLTALAYEGLAIVVVICRCFYSVPRR